MPRPWELHRIARPSAASVNRVRILLATDKAGVRSIVGAATHRCAELTTHSCNDLYGGLRTASSADLVVLDFQSFEACDWENIVRAARTRLPGASIVALGTLIEARNGFLGLAVTAGLHDLVLIEHDDAPLLIRAHLLDETRCGARADALRSANATLPQPLAPFATALILYSATLRTHNDLAQHVGVSRATLHRHVARHFSPPLSHFDGWCRLLLAAAILERSPFTLARTARALGMRDVRTLSRVSGLLMNAPTATLREPGALAGCVRILARAIAPCSRDDHDR